MNMADFEKNLTASQVAQKVGVSVKTLNGWYGWVRDDSFKKPDDLPALPDYIQIGSRGVRLWSKNDIKLLKKFGAALPKGRNGVMGEYNQKFWGKRAPKDKEENNEQ
jgi:predicted DNA-binding transcriptional regulator AlpA